MDMTELLKWLPEEAQQRLLQLETTFGSEGWKTVVGWAQEARDATILRGAQATSWEDNRIALGQSRVYDEVINMAERIFTEYANMADEAKTDFEIEAEEDFE